MNSQPASAAQTVPYKINFQGRLTNSSGVNMADGSYNMRFRIYTVSSGGSATWTETRDASTARVSVTSGLFKIQLGDYTALSPSTFTSYPLYLEVELPTTGTATCSTVGCASWTEGAMTPRQTIGATPQAMNSDTLDGMDATAFGQLGSANTYTSTNTIQATNANAFSVQSNAGANTLFTVDTSGNQVSVGNSAADGTGVLFRLDNKNTTGDPAGVAGAMYYNSFSSKFRCYQGAAWADCIGTGSGGGDVYLANNNTFTGTNSFQNTGTSAFQIQSASGAATLFSVDTSNSRVYVGNSTADATGVVIVLDTKNTAGDPTGVVGAMYYNSNAGKFRCYQGSAWTDCIGSGASSTIVHETVTLAAGNGPLTWTNMPAALTEVLNVTRYRTKVDLTNATQARLTVGVGVAGATNAELRIQYSTDRSTWNYLDNSSGPGVVVGGTPLDPEVSSWVTITAGARADVYIRIVGVNGDGVIDPTFGIITLQYK